jgi:capsular exopolysaccharide synthesis family protein
MDSEQTNLRLERVLATLGRRAPWIVLCVVLVAGGAYGFSEQQTKKYTATASLVFNENQLAEQFAGLPVAGGSSPQAQHSRNLKLLGRGDIAAKSAGLLGRGFNGERVRAALSVSANGESSVVDVSATATSPALAAGIANTYTRQFVIERESSDHAYYVSALRPVEKRLATLSRKQRASTSGLALQGRAQALAVFAELRNGNVQTLQAATVPTSPSSPKVSRNTILGAVLGLVLGLVGAFLIEHFDRRIREPMELAAIYDLPLLGLVPESKALARAARRKGNAGVQLPPGEEEAFHLILAQLRYFDVESELRTLLLASAIPGEGKTTVARHLASTAARMGLGVLLIEADLRHPTLAGQLDLHAGPGVSDVMIGAASLYEATQTIDVDSRPVDASEGQLRLGVEIFDVVVAGAPLPPNSGELLAGDAMDALLEQARSMYDVVMIDTTALTAGSDALGLLGKVDGVIIVGKIGRSRRDVAVDVHETLASWRAPLLGVVATGVKAGRGGAGGYAADGYAYGDAQDGAYDYADDDPYARSATAEASGNGASSSAEPVPPA